MFVGAYNTGLKPQQTTTTTGCVSRTRPVIGDDDLLQEIMFMHATARTQSQFFLLLIILPVLPVFRPSVLLILPVLAAFQTTLVLHYSLYTQYER